MVAGSTPRGRSDAVAWTSATKLACPAVRSTVSRTARIAASSGAFSILGVSLTNASLQLVILWHRHWHDMTPLPMHIDRFRLFDSLSAQPVRCLVKAATSDGGESLTADIVYTDASGRVLAMLDGLQCACTRALNRLSNRNARQTDILPGVEKRPEAAKWLGPGAER